MFALAALLLVALGFGGGGVRYGLFNLLVQLTALSILASHPAAFLGFWRNAPAVLRTLVAASLLIPILHLVPLPQGAWTALPGRELVVQSFELVGAMGWSSASVDPARTLVALTGLIVPLTVLAIGWSLQQHQLLILAWVIVALGLINFLIGIPQVTSGGSTAVLYLEREANSVLLGSFANRNSTGILLVVALGLAALLPSPRPHPAALPTRLLLCGLLLIAVVLTRSRTALVLAALPLLLASLRAFWWARKGLAGNRRTSSTKMLWVIAATITLGISALATLAVAAPGRIGETIERFQATDDARIYIWDDATYSASRYWPVGAGMGTFDEVFQVDESLENTTKARAGRAHNDYIEIAIEAGLPGLIVIAGWLLLLGWLSWRARESELKWVAWASAIGLLAIALQSITDYPLRNQTMLAVAAFAVLLLARLAFSPTPRSAAGGEP